MKLRAIRLTDVRRFSGTVAVEGLTDGLNVLCEPNESGKSTLFDALQAVFFLPHRSTAAQADALRPRRGGAADRSAAPQVEVEIDTADGPLRLLKRWLKRPAAEVWQAGRLIAQADEAEALIVRLAGGGDAGPAGLLWVRQGAAGLDDGRKGAALAARQDLMASVTGEVELMTGGKRMQAALDACRADLDRYVTEGGKPKAKGPLKDAEDEVARLEAEEGRLALLAGDLSDALSARRRALRAMADLTDPAEGAARAAALASAAEVLRAAERHAEALAGAAQARDLAALRVESAQGALTRQAVARAEAQGAASEAAGALAANAAAMQARAAADVALSRIVTEAETRATAARGAADRLNAVLRAEAARDGARRRADLTARIAEAETLRRDLETARAAARIGPDTATLRRIEAAAQDLATRRALRDATTAHLMLDYLPGAEGAVSLAGAGLPAGRHPLGATVTLDLRGIGRLTVAPGQGGSEDAGVAGAEARLAGLLQGAGAADADAARAAADARAAAARHADDLSRRLDLIAPEGVEALRTALAAIPEPGPEADLPDLARAEAEARAASEAADAARRATEAARRAADAARTEAARTEAAEAAARARHARARAVLEGAEPADALTARLAGAQSALDAAVRAHAALAADAPDVTAMRATHQRAASVVEAAAQRLRLLSEEIAKLDERITLRSAEAVEETLADTRDRLTAARAALARVRFEVDVLHRLRSALDSARAKARDRYFEPVLRELGPLLRLLWPHADLRFDDRSLLPVALVRAGHEEAFDILSGGTQEQVALLVRLAFARLLAAAGRPAPLILDDALVFTDDDRIEAMFDALHRQAEGQQIIVLTCRQRAFAALGGNALRLRTGD